MHEVPFDVFLKIKDTYEYIVYDSGFEVGSLFVAKQLDDSYELTGRCLQGVVSMTLPTKTDARLIELVDVKTFAEPE